MEKVLPFRTVLSFPIGKPATQLDEEILIIRLVRQEKTNASSVESEAVDGLHAQA